MDGVDSPGTPGGALLGDRPREVGKFSFLGQLVEKTPAAAINAAEDHLAKSAGETGSDDTHFEFPDLVCDDSKVDTLRPTAL